MKILIIGAGCVGTATGEGFRRLGHDVVFHDTNHQRKADLIKQGYTVFDEDTVNPYEMDVVFICVEEWNIGKVFEDWKEPFKKHIVVIRSTVPPGTCYSLSAKYHHEYIIHNPEFLREKSALHDFLYPDKIIIGASPVIYDTIDSFFRKLYEPFNAPIIFTDWKTSEFLKLASNAVLSSYISMWNQIKMIADKLGVNSHQVAKILTLDPRISKYGTIHGKRFAGFCLPKDLESLIKTGVDLKVDTTLLDAIRAINEGMPE